MKHIPSLIILVVIPVYVMGVFVTQVFAPHWSSVRVEAVEQSTVLTFVGDMMFDRYVRERAVVHGYDSIFADVTPLFSETDVLVGNLEGPITVFNPVSNWRDGGPNHYKFTFATTVASTLASVGFDAVTLANNHVLNFGTKGLVQTKDWLSRNNLKYFGAPDEPYVPWRNASGTPVVMYSFDTWYARDAEKLAQAIQQEPEDTFVVVYAHWGDEYDIAPNTGQQKLAHRFIDAGADFVVGAHPHVIQSKEQYRGKWIYYSLGNFVFDQYFSDEVKCGAVVNVVLDSNLAYETQEQFVELSGDGTTKQSECADTIDILVK